MSRITVSAPCFFASRDRGLADGDGIFVRAVGVDRDAELLAEHLQLVDGGGTLQVGGDQQRLAAAGLEHAAELAAGGRFAGALQAAQHQHGDFVRALEVERMVDRAHQVDEFLVDDADDLLAGIERLEDRLADRLLGDAVHEVVDDLEADVGFEQRLLDELEPVAHVRFGELALAAQRLERGTETVLKGFEHGWQGAGGTEQGVANRTAILSENRRVGRG